MLIRNTCLIELIKRADHLKVNLHQSVKISFISVYSRALPRDHLKVNFNCEKISFIGVYSLKLQQG